MKEQDARKVRPEYKEAYEKSVINMTIVYKKLAEIEKKEREETDKAFRNLSNKVIYRI